MIAPPAGSFADAPGRGPACSSCRRPGQSAQRTPAARPPQPAHRQVGRPGSPAPSRPVPALPAAAQTGCREPRPTRRSARSGAGGRRSPGHAFPSSCDRPIWWARCRSCSSGWPAWACGCLGGCAARDLATVPTAGLQGSSRRPGASAQAAARTIRPVMAISIPSPSLLRNRSTPAGDSETKRAASRSRRRRRA